MSSFVHDELSELRQLSDFDENRPRGVRSVHPAVTLLEKLDALRREGARQLLMDVLSTDLRCIDAHAHLGNLEFDRAPDRAILHYEIGMRIGELSLKPAFDGVLIWGHIENRPYLRCMHGYGLCLWQLGELAQAREVFERILSLNPNDNQGVRFCLEDVRRGRSWEEPAARGVPQTVH